MDKLSITFHSPSFLSPIYNFVPPCFCASQLEKKAMKVFQCFLLVPYYLGSPSCCMVSSKLRLSLFCTALWLWQASTFPLFFLWLGIFPCMVRSGGTVVQSGGGPVVVIPFRVIEISPTSGLATIFFLTAPFLILVSSCSHVLTSLEPRVPCFLKRIVPLLPHHVVTHF